VIRTRVGYAGGTKRNPTYHDLGDHSETIQIDYDPIHVSYGKLLDIFWESHDPAARPWSRQYMAAVFTHNEEQERLAVEMRDREAAKRGGRIYTQILPFSGFHLAEAYHQKYRLRHEPLLINEFMAIYPDNEDFVDSTAAARVNGYIAGNGTCAALQRELNSLGLSPAGNKRLLDIVC
jgi:methionine-S-sulfoxide reductase